MSNNIAKSADASASPTAPARVSPVLQFVLLIVPIVMNGFFTVYTITGWLVEGQYRINWSIEAPNVALYVGAGVTLFCLLVLAMLKWRGLAWRHPLGISSIVHAALALALAATVLRVVHG